jgi:hypothetical protein
MASVNATTIWNTTDYLTFVSNINSATNGLLINSVLVGVFLLSWFLMKRYDNVTATLSAAATTSIVMLLVAATGVGTRNYGVVGGVILIVVVLYSAINKD